MSHRKKRKRKGLECELNLAAMLDMAFQLLTFFILTFKPAPVEGQIEVKMPPPKPVTAKSAGGAGSSNVPADAGVNSLVISALPNANGGLGSMAVGEVQVNSLDALEGRLKTVLMDESSPFEQVIVQVGSNLKYEELMKVIDRCTKQKLKDGSPLTKLSFVEAPSG
jgi:biopolymer transport protein ExbD